MKRIDTLARIHIQENREKAQTTKKKKTNGPENNYETIKSVRKRNSTLILDEKKGKSRQYNI
jgi:hypothetical protein